MLGSPAALFVYCKAKKKCRLRMRLQMRGKTTKPMMPRLRKE